MVENPDKSSNRDALTEGLVELGLFAGIKPGPKKTLARFARFQAVAPNEVFVRQGEYTETFYVVLSGVVSAYHTGIDGKTGILETMSAGGWFGEVSALSNHPSLATLKADSRCQVLALDPATFKELYQDPAGAFRKQIDAKYRERSLVAHMRTMPLFKHLTDAKLSEVRRDVQFETFEKGTVIARAGGQAEAVYLVRSGAVACTRVTETGAEQILGYSMNNSSFGERSLLADQRTWPGTYTALARTDAIVIPRAVIERVFGADANTLSSLVQAAALLVEEEQGAHTGIFEFMSDPDRPTGMSGDQLEIMVRRQSVKGGEALVIDLARCTRCNACVESCVAVHEDRVPRLSKKGNRIGAGLNLATSCYNCDIPECMMSCNYGAIRRDVQGLIRFVFDNCVGCSQCVSACPYGVIRLTAPPGEAPVVEDTHLLEQIPLIGNWFKKKTCATKAENADATAPKAPLLNARGQPVSAKSVKCDLCAGLPFEACVYNCPCSAISRVNPAELFARSDVAARTGSPVSVVEPVR